MLNYIIRRTAYSALIILGVLILTFVLFRVAAGDPASVVLGKNPSPKEIEELRMELGTDKPLIWGKWRHTEVFSNIDFTGKNLLPAWKISGEYNRDNGFLDLRKGKIQSNRNFTLNEVPVRAEITFKGAFLLNGKNYQSENWTTIECAVPKTLESLELETAEGAGFRQINFYRQQQSGWNSQLFDSLKEIVSFSSAFPYVSFLNFGRTLITREPVRQVLGRGVWPSLVLMLPIFFGELILGIILALLCAAFKDSWIDRGLVLVSVAGMSISYLVFIIFGQWYLGYYFNWFPVWGWGDLQHLALPVIIGVISGLGGGVRFYRTVFINELNREYLRTAQAKGCSSISIYTKHLLRNAMIPIITRAATVLPFLFTGSLLLETFFGIPGLGYIGVNALMNSDLQMIKALVIVGAFLFVFINLLTDIAYAWADPRIRLK